MQLFDLICFDTFNVYICCILRWPWVLVSLRPQVQLQIILEPDNLPDYVSVSYDCTCDNSLRKFLV